MDESIVKHLEQPQQGTLKLSEAIRIGARLRPQQTNGRYMNDGKSCALGAAYEAVTGRYDENTGLIPWFQSQYSRLDMLRIGAAIMLRNDRGESRESIADWLQGIGF